MSKPASAAEYVLGVNAAELERLGFQHQLWSSYAHELWERAGLTRGMTVLDAGAGPGFAATELAQLVGPEGLVKAVDEAPMYVEYLRERAVILGLKNLHCQLGDVQRLGETDIAPGSIDFAYMRWVLCFVPDPDAAIAGVARMLRPGGVFALQDYFNYRMLALAPRSALLEKVVAAVESLWRKRGGDPDIVGRLPQLFRRHGLELREVTPAQRVARPHEQLWHWPTTFFRNFLPELVKHGELSAEDRQKFEAEWAERTADPDAVFVAPTVFSVVGVKR